MTFMRRLLLPLSVCVLLACTFSAAISAQGELQIHFVDVGQGDCTIISCPNGNKILVDCGSGFACSNTAATNYVRSVLDGELFALVVTHPDTDHYGIIEATLSGITPDHLFRVAGPRTEYGSCGFENWLRATENNNQVTTHELPVDFHDPANTPNSNLDCGNADIFVLAANVQHSFSAKNTESIVLLVSFGDFEAILTGDATEKTEEKILGWYTPNTWLQSELYKIPHHGSSTTSEDQELGIAAEPVLAIASAGFSNPHGHPRKVAIRKLTPFLEDADPHKIRWCTSQKRCRNKTIKKDIYTTAKSGTIVVGSDGSSYWISERQERSIQ